MSSIKIFLSLAALLVFVPVLFTHCGDKAAPSLFDPNKPGQPQPVIQAIVPADSALAGVGEVVINGQNFSDVPEENLVFFNGVRVQVLRASTTELGVRPPVLVADSIQIKIAVHRAELFSEPFYYKLVAAVANFGKIFEGDIAYGITTDADGNVFVFIQGRSNRIVKITSDGSATDFAVVNYVRANGMKMGSGNVLYVVPSGILRRIVTYAPDGSETNFVSFGRTIPEITDLELDENGNVWVTAGDLLYRVKPDKSFEQLATFPVLLTTVRIFDNFIYVGGQNVNTGEEKIWRSEIQGDALGPQEVVLDVAAAAELAGAHVNAITFAADGDMVLGTTNQNAIFILSPDGGLEPLYPGLIEPQIYALSWPAGEIMYAVRQRVTGDIANPIDLSQIYKIRMGREGAPYFGR